MFRVIIASSLIGLLALSISCSSIGRVRNATPTVLNWDLSQKQDLHSIGWENKEPLDNSFQKDNLQEDGDFDLTLKLSDDRILHERIHHIYVTKRNSTITELRVATFPVTLDEAHAKAQQLINYWQFDPRNLAGDKLPIDEWYAKQRQSKGIRDYKFESNKNAAYPSLSLIVAYSFNETKPWFILFQVYWLKPGQS